VQLRQGLSMQERAMKCRALSSGNVNSKAQNMIDDERCVMCGTRRKQKQSSPCVAGLPRKQTPTCLRMSFGTGTTLSQSL
jgi:hypothetical protein